MTLLRKIAITIIIALAILALATSLRRVFGATCDQNCQYEIHH